MSTTHEKEHEHEKTATFGEPEGKPAESAVSRVTISHTTVGALDCDPLFSTESAHSSMGARIAPLLPYLKAALLKLPAGPEEATASKILAEAMAIADREAHDR